MDNATNKNNAANKKAEIMARIAQKAALNAELDARLIGMVPGSVEYNAAIDQFDAEVKSRGIVI